MQEDGTYRYAFVFDPYLESADYSIPSLLERAYGKDEAERYMESFDTYHEGDTHTPFVQSE